jgi:hypothetical protein
VTHPTKFGEGKTEGKLRKKRNDRFLIRGNPGVLPSPPKGHSAPVPHVDVSYAALEAYGIINVALHREYSPGIVIIFFQWMNDLYHV